MKNGTRILLIDYMLKKLTDEDNFLSRNDFIERINELGGNVSDNTIKSDLDCIREFNQLLDENYKEILGKSDSLVSGVIGYENVKKKGSHITKSIFTEGELIILFKFIENCFYLNGEEKKRLIQKITLLVSQMTINKIGLNNAFDETNYYNPHNHSLININIIQKAIQQDLCLKFKYLTYEVKNNSLKEVSINRSYYIYPIRFVMEGNYLYVIGYDLTKYNQEFMKDTSKQLKVKNYRIDRMHQLQTAFKPKFINDCLSPGIIEEAKKQINNNINGFGGNEYISLKLKINISNGIEKSPFKTFVDRFGKDIKDVYKESDYVCLTIHNVLNGIGLIHFLFAFDSQIEVVEPQDLREEIKERLIELYRIYNI